MFDVIFPISTPKLIPMADVNPVNLKQNGLKFEVSIVEWMKIRSKNATSYLQDSVIKILYYM